MFIMLQAVIVVIWLIVCAASDLKSRSVPTLLTLIPLLSALIMTVFKGYWPVAALVVVLVFISDLPKSISSVVSGMAVIAAGFICWKVGLSIQTVQVCVLLFVIWQLWIHGLTGGADAKILMTLILFYGGGVFLAATLAGGVFGLAALAVKKRTLPYVLPILAGTVAYLVLQFTHAI